MVHFKIPQTSEIILGSWNDEKGFYFYQTASDIKKRKKEKKKKNSKKELLLSPLYKIITLNIF